MTPIEQDKDAQARLLARYGQSFAPGEVLFTDGDDASVAYMLQDGRVRLIKRVGATERSLRILRPGDLFGESALISGATRNSTAVAATEGTVLVIDQRTLEHIIATNPAVGIRVMQQLVKRLRDAEDQIEVLMLEDSRSKIVLTLLKLAQQSTGGALASEGGSVELILSPMELSARVGLDLESVKRTVQQLRESGHLQIIGERIEIPNLESLRELSNLLTVRDQIVGMPRESRPVRAQREF